jgi:hypothetical protein
VKPLCFLQDRRLQTGLATNCHEGVVVARRMRPREEDETLATESLQGERAPPGEGMAFGKHGHERLAHDWSYGQRAIAGGEPQKPGMDLTVA